MPTGITTEHKHKWDIMKEKFRITGAESFEEFRIPIGKRLFDIFFATFSIIIFSPLILLVALLIKIDSKGPVLYVSRRVGTGYDIFKFYKFRSMYLGSEKKLTELSELNQYLINQHKKGDDPEEDECPDCKRLGYPCSPILYIDGNQICENLYLHKKRLHSKKATFFKVRNDPRVTRIGKLIRRTNLDELPQLYNVLKGDMSIVGNRPLPLYEAEMLTNDQWALRFLAPAGITGLWQVHYNKKQNLSEEERKNLDNKYALNASFWNDIKIILQTFLVLFRKKENL